MNEATGKRTKSPSRTLTAREERQPMSREQIIKKAILDKIGADIEIFTASDILTVAEISTEEIKSLTESIENEAAKKSVKRDLPSV